jgi:hypothetical protein
MTTAGTYDWLVDQGSTAELLFTLYSDLARTTPESLSGAVISGKVRKSPEATAVIATFVGTVIDGPNGEGKVSLDAATTAAIVCDNSGAGNRVLTTFIYDIEVLYADGKTQRVLEGNFYLSPEATR